MKRVSYILPLLVAMLCFAAPAFAEQGMWRLLDRATVDSAGIFLDQVFVCDTQVPHIRLAEAPRIGQTASLSRAKIAESLAQQGMELVMTNVTGASTVVVTRRTRQLAETELKDLLTATLQREMIRDRGELELQFTRAWNTVSVPDEPLTLRINDLPNSGVTPSCVLRFELRSAAESAGTWQVPIQAKVWREIWVAQSPLRRGLSLRDAEMARERRDVLTLRDALAEIPAEDNAFEIGESVMAGAPIYARSLKLRAVVRRGKVVDAVVEDSAISIAAKAEVLEDGAPGQTIRLRNVKSRREFKGKVKDEETVLVSL